MPFKETTEDSYAAVEAAHVFAVEEELPAARMVWGYHDDMDMAERYMDMRMQSLVQQGFRIVDSQLHMDPTEDPRVWGWILYDDSTRRQYDRSAHPATADSRG